MARVYPVRSKYPLRADPTVFTPRKVPDLLLWMSTRTAASVQSGGVTAVNNSEVDTWNSLILSHQYTQTLAGQKPLLKTNVQNGLPVIEFDGSNDFLKAEASVLTLAKAIAGMTVVISFGVVSLPAGDGNVFNFTTGTGAGSSRVNVTVKSTGARNITGRALDADSNSNFSTANTWTAGSFEILTCQWDFTNKQGRIRRNGTTEANWTTFTNMTAGSTSNTNSQAGNIGNLNSSTYVNVRVGDILVYPKALSDSDCQYLERGLGTIWGVSVA